MVTHQYMDPVSEERCPYCFMWLYYNTDESRAETWMREISYDDAYGCEVVAFVPTEECPGCDFPLNFKLGEPKNAALDLYELAAACRDIGLTRGIHPWDDVRAHRAVHAEESAKVIARSRARWAERF